MAAVASRDRFPSAAADFNRLCFSRQLLQCTSPLVARRVTLRRCNSMSEFGGTADIRALWLPASTVANDPLRTSGNLSRTTHSHCDSLSSPMLVVSLGGGNETAGFSLCFGQCSRRVATGRARPTARGRSSRRDIAVATQGQPRFASWSCSV
jgi:hypothetical protein